MSQIKREKTFRPRVPRTDQQSLLEQCNALQQEVAELKKSLNTELTKGSSLQKEHQMLSQELSEMRTQWQRQKTLKEMYINKGKETQRELESLKKYSNPETLSTERIAAQVRNDIRQKQKKELHKDYEELRVAYLISQEKFKAELQVERDRNTSLQKELDSISAVPHQVNQGQVSDAAAVRQEADRLQQQLEEEIQQKKILLTHYKELQAEHQSSQERFTAELQVEREKNKPLQEELEKIKEVNCRYETDLISFRQQVETLQHELKKEVQQRQLLQKECQELQVAHTQSQEKFAAELQVEKEKNRLLQESLDKTSAPHQEDVKELQVASEDRSIAGIQILDEAENPQEKPDMQQESVPTEQALELSEEDAGSTVTADFEEMPPVTATKPSVLKRMCHCLGLRKPKRWKK